MIIQPKVWGFICTNAHPAGCEAAVRDQIAKTRAAEGLGGGPERVLVIGASTGYGLAARITAAFGYQAETIGVSLEKPPRGKRTGTAGWYNGAAFEQCAAEADLTSITVNGDAFANATRERVIELIRRELSGPVDLVIYSLAAPARKLPESGETVRTALKPIGGSFSGKTIDTDHDRLMETSVEAATDAEIAATERVMGGEDWARWIDALTEAGVLAEKPRTVAYSYLGPEITWPIYRDGTIGHAKQELETTATTLRQRHAGLDARVAVLKSIVTQASAAIPVMPLYMSLVFKVMKEKGLHEGAIEQQNRLFRDFLHSAHGALDHQGRYRLDGRELRDDVQRACMDLWPYVNDSTLFELTDYAGYKRDFMQLFGFERDDIDYSADVPVAVAFDCVNLK